MLFPEIDRGSFNRVIYNRWSESQFFPMFQRLTEVKLKTGETVSAAVVQGPDWEWASRIESLLAHKGDPWNWQNSELLRENTGTSAKFYFLHRDGRPFSNIMLVECAGVALLGHVWTEPADRGAGASGILMELLLGDFRASSIQAIFLGTEVNSEPFHYYERRGFVPIAAGSGYMVLSKDAVDKFYAAWFDDDSATIRPLDWTHWAAAAPLCLGGFPQKIRIAATGFIGRLSSEGPLLPAIRRQKQASITGAPNCAIALYRPLGAVLGLASLLPDPIWPKQDVLDLFLHPRAWNRATELIHSLPLNPGRACIAYTDVGAVRKIEALSAAGFAAMATLPRWLPGGDDVTVWRRG